MFGQQSTNPLALAAKWIFFGFFGVILMGFLLGANIKDATWLNSNIAAAQANRMNIENAHQQATYELQVRLATAQTEAEIREIQRQQLFLDAQYQHDIQALSQDLAHQELAFRTWMTVLTIIASGFAAMLFISTTLWVGSRALVYVRSFPQKGEPVMKPVPPIEKRIPNLPERDPYDPWNSPAYRRSKRKAAQDKERKEREEIAARMMKFRDPGRISPENYKKNPQADE
jgi:hypothetical protein